jgi:hypothetical protein
MTNSITILATATFSNAYGTESIYHQVRRAGDVGWISDMDLKLAGDRTQSGDWCVGLHPESDLGERVNPGTLTDYRTGDAIRPATIAERDESREAAKFDGGAGVIEIDGVSCYVAE